MRCEYTTDIASVRVMENEKSRNLLVTVESGRVTFGVRAGSVCLFPRFFVARFVVEEGKTRRCQQRLVNVRSETLWDLSVARQENHVV